MKHPTEAEWVDWVGGRSPPGRRAALEDHLAACPSCRRLADDLRRTWEALGRWQPRSPGRDLRPAIETQLRRDASGGRRSTGGWMAAALRVAAAVAVALIVGHAAGRWVRPGAAGLTSYPAPMADDQAVADTLRLNVLGAESSVGLSGTLLDLAEGASSEDPQ